MSLTITKETKEIYPGHCVTYWIGVWESDNCREEKIAATQEELLDYYSAEQRAHRQYLARALMH